MASPSRTSVVIRRSGAVPTLAHAVRVTGSPRVLRFPGRCACCGAAATGRLPVTRAFNRDWRWAPVTQSVDHFRFVSVQTLDVPFCDACMAQHRREVRPVGMLGALLSAFTTVFVIPLAVALLAVVLYFAPSLVDGAGGLVQPPSTAARALVFAAAAAAFAGLAWHQTRPRRVTPPTTVTAAFDFSDNLGGLFGPERRVYGMSQERFAQEFAALNGTD